jgi:O-antigen/teichoic acid export membrane protein
MRLWYKVAIGLIRQLLWLVAVVLLAMRNAAFYEVIVARTMVGVLEGAIIVWSVKKTGLIQGKREFISEDAWMMLRAGLPLVLTTLASGIYHRIDQVMLHKMSGDRVLGPYVIAVQLTELFSALPIALMTSLFPALAQNAKHEEKFKRYLGETYRFLLVVVFAACALASPVAAPLIELFYGKQYLPTAGLLIVLIWSEVPIFYFAALGKRASVVRHADGRLLRAARPRFTFSRMSDALAVQMNGLGSLLCCSTEAVIVVTSSLTL